MTAWRHGTVYGYQHHRCRCDDCCIVASDYRHKYNNRPEVIERNTRPVTIDTLVDLFNTKDRAFMARGACVGVAPGLMFPTRGQSCTEAKAVCKGCEVKVECLAYALAHNERFGVWGQTTERQRRRMRSSQRRVA